MAKKKKKVKWKRTREGIVFVEQQSLSERLSKLGFMQVSMSTFFAALALIFLALLIAVVTNGRAPLIISVLWVAAFGMSLIGLWATWYGHFQVKAESKLRWKYGIYTNGAVFVLLTVIYIVGLRVG